MGGWVTKFALVRVEGMTREVLGAKGVSPGCTADTRDHTDYPLTVCDHFMGKRLTLQTMQVRFHIQTYSQPLAVK